MQTMSVVLNSGLSVKTTKDHERLQQDLNTANTLVEWTEQWQMKLNPAKCVILNCYQISITICSCLLHKYRCSTPLNSVEQHKYLGVMMNKSMSWSGHIQEIINKAIRFC